MKRVMKMAFVACAPFALATSLIASPAYAAPTHDPTPNDEKPHVVRTIDEAVKRDLSISTKEYIARSETANKLSNFWKDSEKKFADSVSSVKMEGPAGIVAIKDGTPTTKTATDTAKSLGFKTVAGELSRKEVETNTANLAVRTDRLPAELKGKVLGSPQPNYQEGTTNVYVLGDQAAESLRKVLVGPESKHFVITEEGKPSAQEVGSQKSVAPGAAYLASGKAPGADKEQTVSCSAAFPATDSEGSKLLVTAGHCGVGQKDGTAIFQDGKQIGAVVAQAFGGMSERGNGYDYALIKVSRDFNKEDLPQTGLKAATEPIKGAPACKLGARTGANCGLITSESNIMSVKAKPGQNVYVSGFSMDVCSKPGDSGGAIMSGPYALGIVSSGASDNCQAPDKDKGIVTAGTKITSILEASETAAADDHKYGKSLKLFATAS